jgi:hypothetical protein
MYAGRMRTFCELDEMLHPTEPQQKLSHAHVIFVVSVCTLQTTKVICWQSSEDSGPAAFL